MPVTIDIREDARYQQGVMDGMKEVIAKIASNPFSKGFDIAFVREAVSLSLQELGEIQRAILEKEI